MNPETPIYYVICTREAGSYAIDKIYRVYKTTLWEITDNAANSPITAEVAKLYNTPNFYLTTHIFYREPPNPLQEFEKSASGVRQMLKEIRQESERVFKPTEQLPPDKMPDAGDHWPNSATTEMKSVDYNNDENW